MLVLADEVVDMLLGFSVPFDISRAGEEPDDDSGEEVRSQIDVVDDAVDPLVRQQTFVEALVQEVVVQNNDFVYCLHLQEVFFEFVEVRLEHLVQHVVEVVLAELEHLVPGSVGLRKHPLNVALLG